MTILEICLLVGTISLQVLLARWVMRDAAARNLNALLWGAVVFTSSLVGLAAYAWLRTTD